jgi:hypothetical protein
MVTFTKCGGPIAQELLQPSEPQEIVLATGKLVQTDMNGKPRFGLNIYVFVEPKPNTRLFQKIKALAHKNPPASLILQVPDSEEYTDGPNEVSIQGFFDKQRIGGDGTIAAEYHYHIGEDEFKVIGYREYLEPILKKYQINTARLIIRKTQP